MAKLSVMLSKLNIGYNANSVFMNHVFYADDSVLLAPSARALQKNTDICFKYKCLCMEWLWIKYNLKETECMCVKPK